MEPRIEEYTVGQLARAARISVRTLHHYDAIGLLKPAHIGANGYRLYARAEAERLQEILFYRATGMDLSQIGALLDGEGDRIARLTAHRARLAAEADALDQMIATLDRTIADIKGARTMALEDLYTPFPAETQADHEAWLIDTYGPGMAAEIARAKARLDAAPEGMDAHLQTLREIEGALVEAYRSGLADPGDLLDRHRAWVAEMWGRDCPPEAYAGLAQLYRSHPDFVARYEALADGFSVWLPDVMEAYAASREG